MRNIEFMIVAPGGDLFKNHLVLGVSVLQAGDSSNNRRSVSENFSDFNNEIFCICPN